jgi:hypothetical protein
VFLYRQRHPQHPQVAALQRGDRVLPVRGTLLNGQLLLEAYSRPIVLYVFSPTCSWCERNLDNARTIASAAGERYGFLGIVTIDSGIAEYVSSRRLDWPVVKNVPLEILESLKILGTPQTILVDKGGIVLNSWSGALAGPVVDEVEAQLGVRLPGLLEPK